MGYQSPCDMRGMLSFQILWLLSKKRMHGQMIAKEIGKRRGEIPKASTLYPALKNLHEDRLISGKKTGKIITYSLTPAGKAAVNEAKRYFVRSFRDILES